MTKVNKVKQKEEKFIAELAHCEITVNDNLKTGKKVKYYPNKCYEKADEYLLDKRHIKGIKLVHGLYTIFEIPHAWVELPDDIVFDGVLQRFYKKEGYYDTYQIKKIKEYSAEEAYTKMIETGRHDFW